jgi:hypothetical protein
MVSVVAPVAGVENSSTEPDHENCVGDSGINSSLPLPP